jgi:hypothetical protein
MKLLFHGLLLQVMGRCQYMAVCDDETNETWQVDETLVGDLSLFAVESLLFGLSGTRVFLPC